MTTVALKRGAPPRRRAAPPRRKHPTTLVRVPIAPPRLRRHLALLFVALVLTAAGVGAWLAGMPQRWLQQGAQAAARAGFEVRHVEVAGVGHTPRLAVYAAAFDGATNSMLLVDLAAVRTRLRALPWVADASVTRRLPDTLVVRVTERVPVALWQYRRHVFAIDRTGARLTDRGLASFAHLPLLVGAEANEHASEVLSLLARYPRVGAAVDAATLVGGRRWDLRFDSGETLALPEGALPAATALARFETLDRAHGLLGKGFARFDLRLPGRMTVRVGTATAPPPGDGKGVEI